VSGYLTKPQDPDSEEKGADSVSENKPEAAVE
jgi:hypothetical protein